MKAVTSDKALTKELLGQGFAEIKSKYKDEKHYRKCFDMSTVHIVVSQYGFTHSFIKQGEIFSGGGLIMFRDAERNLDYIKKLA